VLGPVAQWGWGGAGEGEGKEEDAGEYALGREEDGVCGEGVGGGVEDDGVRRVSS